MLSRNALLAVVVWFLARDAIAQSIANSTAAPASLPSVDSIDARERIFQRPALQPQNAAQVSIDVAEPNRNPPRLTLTDLHGIALQHHPVLIRAAAAVAAARGNHLQVGLPPNPTFAAGEQQLGSDGRAEQDYLAVSQEFVMGGKLRLNRAVAAKDLTTAELELSAQRQRVMTDVRIAFYTALIAQQQRVAVEEIVDMARQGLKAAQDEAKGTAVGRNDILEAQIELRTAEIEARNTLNRQLTAWRLLAAAVGDPSLPFSELEGTLTLPLTERDWSTALAILENRSPEMAVAVTKLHRAQLALRRASAEKVPNVTVDALVNVRDNGIGGDPDGGLQVSFPLPLWNRNQGAVAQATAQVMMAQQDVERLRLELQHRLATVFERYSNAYYQVRLYRDEILPAARTALELTRQNYTDGEALYDDLLTSQRTYSTSNLAYLAALLELWVAEAELDGLLLTGSLTTRD